MALLSEEAKGSQEHSASSVIGSQDQLDVTVPEEAVSEDVQDGVRKAQAVTLVWTKTSLIFAYACIFLIYLINSYIQQVVNVLTPFVTSDFELHSLTAITNVLSSIIGGLTQLPLSKVLDIWGRPQGFALMIFVMTIGLVMMAATNNVRTYCAAQVFYAVGQNGMTYSLTVFIADTSALKNRALMFAFASSPYIITTWIGGPTATSLLNNWGWRWGFGIFAIVTPLMAAPLLSIFIINHRKAMKLNLLPASQMKTTLKLCKEFDVIGLLLVVGGTALFLLPFSLYSFQAKQWASPMIICMLVFGLVLLICFAIWESKVQTTFIPWSLLSDRTVLGANIVCAVTFISYFIWDSYFYSFLLVVNNRTVTQASYIDNIYSIVSCFWAILVGWYIRKFGFFKPLALFFGLPLMTLGIGLMIHFRQPDVNVGYLVMCQIFIAVAGGTVVIAEELAVMAATDQQHIAVVLAVQGTFSSIGGALGSTIAEAIWTGTFEKNLAALLPPESQGDLDAIYGDLDTQLSYPIGGPTRVAISEAYGISQKYMLIASLAMMGISFVSVAIWRNYDVRTIRQTKGNVV